MAALSPGASPPVVATAIRFMTPKIVVPARVDCREIPHRASGNCPRPSEDVLGILLYKTDIGGVRLGVTGAQHARAEYNDLLASVAAHAPGAHVSGVLVQPMVIGGRE